ncbi:MAG TPA: hypothetical protein VNW53_11695 [Phenylobacterium sp.]|jgi:hypothetical protein|uniref:hypothetical protein n=1 Tax=Phenylobacterium sp. TaxID=1871053 RepID=UPI002B872A11|nr:hypothetical protein [Phenylobacterium sp.]HXA39656.1 hypothetical protein [Phenylobacterium sp.]
MRDLIRFAAAVFVVLGGIIFAVCAAMTLGIFASEAGVDGATIPGMVVAFGGLVSGSSIVLVGGTAYLMASIDQRLEFALRKSDLAPAGGSMTADELAAAQVG